MGVAAATLPAVASAQDVIVMRRVVAKPTRSPATGPATPTPTPTPASPPRQDGYYNWVVSDWTQTGACGSEGQETRTVSCDQTGAGTVDDSLCTRNGSGPRPISARPATITATCSYSWVAGDFSAGTTTCGSSTRTRSVTCMRSDATVVANSSCASPPPSITETTTDTSGCSYQWQAGSWSGPTNTCGSNNETRHVWCQRSDGTTVADASCQETRPATSQTVYDTDGCSSQWVAGPWSTTTPACGGSSQNRSVTCQRSDGQVVNDSECTDPRPSATQPESDYSACTDGRTNAKPYNWTTGSYGSPSTTCGDATLTRSVQCLDGSGATAPSSMCVGDAPAATTVQHETSGCGFSWSASAFGDPQPGCGATVQTRDVQCLRADGTYVSDYQCAGIAKPSTTQSATDYSACTFGWTAGAYSPPSTNCGSAVETRTIACQRSDGTTADDAQCASAGAKPSATQSSYETSGCGYSWQTGQYSAPTPACGATTQSRTVACLRADGQAVDDTQCSSIGPKPSGVQTAVDYSTCSFAWGAGQYSGSTTTCGTYTQTRSVFCQRSDGTNVDGSNCQGTAPSSSQTITDVSSCSYSWSPEPWGAAAAACGASTHSRTIDCLRSDGTIVDASSCSGSGAKPATTAATTDYSTCSYSWAATNWQGTAGCGDTVTQNRTVSCQRSNGDDVTAANQPSYQFCSKSSMPPATQPITDYSQCSYSWKQVIGAWSSTCSTNATRSNVVTCVRQDGTTVDGSYCDAGSKPSTSDTQGVFTSCTYAATFSGTYGACAPTAPGSSTGSQSAQLTACTRSDGVDVTSANATGGYAYCAASTTRSCAATYTYAGTYGTPGTCTATTAGGTAGTQTAQITGCTATASDGTKSTVANSNCAATQSTACSLTYTATYGTPGTCTANSAGSSSGTQTAQIATCTAVGSDGSRTAVSNSYCTGTQSTACTVTYGWATGAYSAPTNTCGSNTETRSVTCQGSDGSTAADSVCSGTKPSASQTVSVTSGCTYSYVDGAWSAPSSTCSSTATETRTVTCTRSDGTAVDAKTYCGNMTADSTTQTVAVYTGCQATLVNGDFSKSSTGWTVSGAVYFNGSNAQLGSYSGASPSISQTVTGLKPGQTYTVSMNYYNASTVNNFAYVGYAIANASGTYQKIAGSTTASFSFTFVADGTSDLLTIYNRRSDQGLYIDNVYVN